MSQRENIDRCEGYHFDIIIIRFLRCDNHLNLILFQMYSLFVVFFSLVTYPLNDESICIREERGGILYFFSSIVIASIINDRITDYLWIFFLSTSKEFWKI